MKHIASQLAYKFVICISAIIAPTFAHAGIEPLYRTVCIPELQYFSFSDYSYTSTQTLYDFKDNDFLRNLWEKTGFIDVTDFTEVDFEDAESYNFRCDIRDGISFYLKLQPARRRCYGETDQDLKITYGEKVIYQGEISKYPCGDPSELKSLEYSSGKFTLENYMTSWPLAKSISLNVEYFPELLNTTDGVISNEHEAFKLPFTLEKFLSYIQPEEEMAIYEPQTTIKRFPSDAKDDFVEFLHITCTPQIKHFSLRRINVDAKFAKQYNQDGLAEKLWEKYGVIYTTDNSDKSFDNADKLEVTCDGMEYKPPLQLIIKRQLVPDNQKQCDHEIKEYFKFLHDGNIVYEGVGTDDFCNDSTKIELLEFDGDRLKINATSNDSYIEILDFPSSKSHYEYEEAPVDFTKIQNKLNSK